MTDDERQSVAAAVADEGPPPGAEEGIEVEPSVLVWARKSSGLDEERAAKKIGVVVATLRNWESGKKTPSITQLRKLAVQA